MKLSKERIRKGLREAIKILIEKVEGTSQFVFMQDGLNETERLCEVMSEIGEALKHYDGEILEEMEEEEELVAKIVEADEFTLEINRVIGKVKGGFKPSELSESSSPQMARRPILKVGKMSDLQEAAVQSEKTNKTDTFAQNTVHVGICLVNETHNDSISTCTTAIDLSKKPCIFCSEIHAPWTCSNVTNTSERKQIIKEKRLCLTVWDRIKLHIANRTRIAKTVGNITTLAFVLPEGGPLETGQNALPELFQTLYRKTYKKKNRTREKQKRSAYTY